jgi:Cytochrome P460
MSNVRHAGLVTAAAVVFGVLSYFSIAADGQTPAAGEAPIIDAAGNLRIPEDYRRTYQYLGSWAVAGEDKGSKQIHVVYASPGAVDAYQKDGHFPDGAILVKEVYDAVTGSMTTGEVSREDKLDGWFMMVRDSKNTHEGNKLWGDGWGWSWFDAATPAKGKTVSYGAECKGCHVPARATDWIYVQGYPPLRK